MNIIHLRYITEFIMKHRIIENRMVEWQPDIVIRLSRQFWIIWKKVLRRYQK